MVVNYLACCLNNDDCTCQIELSHKNQFKSFGNLQTQLHRLPTPLKTLQCMFHRLALWKTCKCNYVFCVSNVSFTNVISMSIRACCLCSIQCSTFLSIRWEKYGFYFISLLKACTAKNLSIFFHPFSFDSNSN
jgi:hypothetical protein